MDETRPPGVAGIVRDIGQRLASQDIHVRMRARSGGWTNPSQIEVEAEDGSRTVLPFWADSPAQEPRIAKALLNDIYRFVGHPDKVVE